MKKEQKTKEYDLIMDLLNKYNNDEKSQILSFSYNLLRNKIKQSKK